MFQKVKQMCRKAKGFIQGVSTKVKMLALTLFSGTTAMAQSTAGDYSAGTTALSYRGGGNCQVCTSHGQALLCHRRCSRHYRRHLRLHRHEQRRAGCQKEDHDGGWCMSFPDCSSTGSSFVFRH